MKRAWLVCSILLLVTGAVAQGNFVYTDDNNSPNTVSAFSVASDGSLTLIPGSPFLTGGNGGGGNVDPQQITTITVGTTSFLYAANDGSGTISGFVIDPQTGALTAVPGSPFPSGSPGNFSVTASANGQFLFVSDGSNPNLHAFSISAQTGTLSEIAGSPFATAGQSQGLKVSPNGRFLVAGLRNNNAVGTFSIDGTGALTPVGIFPASGLASSEEVNCKSNRVYNVNAGSNLIDVYAIDETGVLIPIDGSPFSNGSESGSFALVLSPNRQFLFASDGFGAAISSLGVRTNGALQPVPGSPFATFQNNWVSQVAITADGQFLYASMFAIGAVDAHRVNPDGTLAPVGGFSTGQPQVGILSVTTFPAPTCTK